jgi:hypothetical protein
LARRKVTPRQRRRVWAGVRVGVVSIVVVPRGVARARVVVVAAVRAVRAVRAVGTVGAPRSRAIAGAVRSVSPGRAASAVAVAVAVAIVVNRAAEEQNAEQAEGAPLPCCE